MDVMWRGKNDLLCMGRNKGRDKWMSIYLVWRERMGWGVWEGIGEEVSG